MSARSPARPLTLICMPSNLMGRVALLVLPGIFLIPIAVSALGDRTHVVTCQEQAKTPFTVVVSKSGPPSLLSSTRLTRKAPTSLCGGLTLDLAAKQGAAGDVEMIVPITNRSRYLWRGTVELTLGDTQVPVDIGSIPAGETRTDRVSLGLDRGSHEVTGSLLIGP